MIEAAQSSFSKAAKTYVLASRQKRRISQWMAGAGTKGGIVYGKSDSKAYAVEENEVAVPDLNATMAMAMGVKLEQKMVSPDGRPFTIAHKGKPLMDLFA